MPGCKIVPQGNINKIPIPSIKGFTYNTEQLCNSNTACYNTSTNPLKYSICKSNNIWGFCDPTESCNTKSTTATIPQKRVPTKSPNYIRKACTDEIHGICNTPDVLSDQFLCNACIKGNSDTFKTCKPEERTAFCNNIKKSPDKGPPKVNKAICGSNIALSVFSTTECIIILVVILIIGLIGGYLVFSKYLKYKQGIETEQAKLMVQALSS
jgi:hypothetical protein